jgi:proline dehydrogenase
VLRALFISLADSRTLRGLAERSSIGQKLSSRFVAGTQVVDVLEATRRVVSSGARVSIDNLGENVTNAEQARASARIYHNLLDEIAAQKLDANISVKLTHMGLDLDRGLARDLVLSLVSQAVGMNPPNFVRIDMEGSPYTQRTLDLVLELHQRPGNQQSIGTVIQSYLRRSLGDVEKLLSAGIRIRLCKGAYQEPTEIAFQKKSEVDANYVVLMKMLLKSGIYHGLATHDQSIIDQAKSFAMREKVPRESFEFQMLYGIRRDLQKRLIAEGYRLRLYVPFGDAWYPYFMRRLAERPANIFFLARHILRQ